MSRPHEGTPPDLWDPVVRVSHWVIAGVVVGNALLTKGGGTVHVWLGWIGMVFLILRLVWGLVGSVEARFAAFPPRPGAAIAHIRHLLKGKPPEYRSHNPAGAMMIYALWASLAIVIGTGVVLTKGATPWEIARQQAAVATGDWSALVTEGDSGEGTAEVGEGGHLIANIHQLGGNLLLILAVLHLGGVAAESVALRRNIVRPMISGRRR
jgi:cytochrome b